MEYARGKHTVPEKVGAGARGGGEGAGGGRVAWQRGLEGETAQTRLVSSTADPFRRGWGRVDLAVLDDVIRGHDGNAAAVGDRVGKTMDPLLKRQLEVVRVWIGNGQPHLRPPFLIEGHGHTGATGAPNSKQMYGTEPPRPLQADVRRRTSTGALAALRIVRRDRRIKVPHADCPADSRPRANPYLFCRRPGIYTPRHCPP